MQMRSKLYKKCGVVLDDVGQIAEDKAVQVEELSKFFHYTQAIGLKNKLDKFFYVLMF